MSGNVIRRVCRKCGTEKPLDEFAKHPRCLFGRTYWCRRCQYAANQARAKERKAGIVSPRRLPAEDRFWAKVQKTDSCWVWIGGASKRGYGGFQPNPERGVVPAHRFSYELLIGSIPEGLELDHLCRNPRCVNPAHLEPVTHSENIQRGESISVLNARKTHCPQGHPYSGENLVVRKGGYRNCRACTARWNRERYLRRKQERKAA
jgi:hypothetical protein